MLEKIKEEQKKLFEEAQALELRKNQIKLRLAEIQGVLKYVGEYKKEEK